VPVGALVGVASKMTAVSVTAADEKPAEVSAVVKLPLVTLAAMVLLMDVILVAAVATTVYTMFTPDVSNIRRRAFAVMLLITMLVLETCNAVATVALKVF
jgi:hypothetical protein